MATSMTSVLGDYGARPKFTDPDTGITYAVMALSHEVMTEYEEQLRQESLLSVMAMRGKVSDEAYKEYLREANALAASHAFSYTGEIAKRSMDTTGGKMALAALLLVNLKENRHPTKKELVDLLRRWGDEVGGIINNVCEESQPRVRAAASSESDGGGSVEENPQMAATVLTRS